MARKPKQDQYQYVLAWLEESVAAREPLLAFVRRTIMAYRGYPMTNSYLDRIGTFANSLVGTNATRAAELMAVMRDIPAKKNMVLQNAVEAVVSMAQGGVGRYEVAPYDPNFQEDDAVFDKIGSAMKRVYTDESVDSLMPQIIRNAVTGGNAAVHVKPSRNGKKKITMLDLDQLLTDPKRMKTNHERFIGFSQRESFAAIKSRTTKTRGGYMLTSLNEADVYLEDIRNAINGVDTPRFQTDPSYLSYINRSVDMFYKDVKLSYDALRDGNPADPNNPAQWYAGDEVEISYLYDLDNDLYFEVVNRTYITIARKSDLSRSVKTEMQDFNNKTVTVNRKIAIDHPIVELPYIQTAWDSFATTPLFDILDDFDSLCAAETLLAHNLSVKGPLTFQGQSSDVEKVSRLAQISGEMVEGIAATFGTLDKTHDDTPVMVYIQRMEEKIKRSIKATDPFEMQAMIGDRASAKEVASMSGQISQGLNPFIANIEAFSAKLGEKLMKMDLIYNTKKAYSFTHNGRYAELEPEEMIGNFEITAKLVSSIKLEQEAAANRAMQLVQYLGQTDKIDEKEFFGTLLPIIMVGTVTREQSNRMIAPKYNPLPEEVIATIRKGEEDRAKRDPIDNMNFDDMTEEELTELTRQVSATTADPNAYLNQEAATPQFDPAAQPLPEEDPALVDPSAPVIDPTQPLVTPGGPANPEVAGELANDNPVIG